MGRTLPWLKEGAQKSLASASRPTKKPKLNAHAASPKHGKGSDDDDKKGNSLSENVEKPKIRRREQRSPSTSPSPSPPPPVEEFMRDGLDGDDIYVMVEDEFYDVARTFTAHLHRAEYARRRRLAHQQRQQRTGAATAATVGVARSAPESSAPSAEAQRVKRRQEASGRQRDGKSKHSVRRAVAPPQDSSTDDEADGETAGLKRGSEELWAGTLLGGLLSKPASDDAQRPLVGVSRPAPRTRAAAGYGGGGGASEDAQSSAAGPVTKQGGAFAHSVQKNVVEAGSDDGVADDLDLDADLPPICAQAARGSRLETSIDAKSHARQRHKSLERGAPAVGESLPSGRKVRALESPSSAAAAISAAAATGPHGAVKPNRAFTSAQPTLGDAPGSHRDGTAHWWSELADGVDPIEAIVRPSRLPAVTKRTTQRTPEEKAEGDKKDEGRGRLPWTDDLEDDTIPHFLV